MSSYALKQSTTYRFLAVNHLIPLHCEKARDNLRRICCSPDIGINKTNLLLLIKHFDFNHNFSIV